MKKQAHVYYIGRVQGVGFRFTVASLALKSGIKGWVKNLYDGKVELLAEAEEAVLNEFLNKISQIFSRYIQNSEIEWIRAGEKFKDFRVEF